ncbi:hypothetical protein A3J33_04300 [candidate division WWE3 bacterium RIFCSPLOWO2_02_FULL_53_10]|uniref:Uncharacterized protein n=1 Tax=candidate division WWE3 bacterium RIFCSPLOWO2_02_FULL_53_10 TaxID=1802629 RepID=A0A1F4WM41_UNCKA|nr:MAG: hypothetical protein A3J33_04300 [candidate division WWE3 bacterium RIFCSPLOWO2_02_FULL_53_10]
MTQQKPPKTQSTTQEHLDILDIQGDLILLKNGNASLVLETTSVNFDLLSEREQDSMIGAYASMLNSLSFPMQLLVRSRKLDLSNYLKWVDEQAAISTQANPYLREKITSYKEFIASLVQKGEVLDKRFYIIIPHFEAVSIKRPGFLDFLLGRKPQGPRINKAEVLERAKTDLEPKRDHLLKQMERLGIKARQLATPELIGMFYEIYNPEQARYQHIAGGAGNYTSTMVEPAIGGEQ